MVFAGNFLAEGPRDGRAAQSYLPTIYPSSNDTVAGVAWPPCRAILRTILASTLSDTAFQAWNSVNYCTRQPKSRTPQMTFSRMTGHVALRQSGFGQFRPIHWPDYKRFCGPLWPCFLLSPRHRPPPAIVFAERSLSFRQGAQVGCFQFRRSTMANPTCISCCRAEATRKEGVYREYWSPAG